jgi:hypothetical protein
VTTATGSILLTNYPARRFTITASASFEDFRRRYEAAVPPTTPRPSTLWLSGGQAGRRCSIS